MTNNSTRYERIFCDNVEYRKGVIELSADIHPGLINLEVFGVKSDVDLSVAPSPNFDLEELVKNRTEVELSLLQAKELSEQLQNAISIIEAGNNDQS